MAVAPMTSAAPTPFVEVPVRRWARGTLSETRDFVTEEVPVALVYHGVPHVVMLASPADLEDYAVGFTVSEGLVASPGEIQSVEVERGTDSIEVRIGIAGERFAELLRRRRNLTGRTGCGLCGAETIEDAIRPPMKVAQGPTVTSADLHAALIQLESMQPVNARTGSIHAAAWVVPGKGVQLVREDVGRHNALDKVIGALVRAGVDVTGGYALDHESRKLRDGPEVGHGRHHVRGRGIRAHRPRRAAGGAERAHARRLRAPRTARRLRKSATVVMKVEPLIKMANQIAAFFEGEAGAE